MAENNNQNRPDSPSEEPTIRFSIDPALLKKAQAQTPEKLEDTYVGAPLLPPEPTPEAPKPDRATPPKWVRVAVLCGAAALVLCLTASLLPPRPWFGRSAEKTVDEFMAALDTGDFARLCQVAEGDEVELTAQKLAPLFAASREDPAFAQAVRACLREPVAGQKPDALFWLENRSSALHRDYRVRVGTGEAAVETNLPAAQIAVGDVPAVWDENRGVAVAKGLLPGTYAVSGTFAAPHGADFQAQTELSVANPVNTCALEFQYSTLEVYNGAAEPVHIQVDGSEYATLEPQTSLTVGPMDADAQVTAVGPRDQLLTATAEDGYLYVAFAMCQVEVYNDYDTTMHLKLEGAWYADIGPREMLTIQDVPTGQQLTAYLDEPFGMEPFQYQVAYDYDYLYPTFQPTEETFEALRLAAESYVLVAYETYAQGAEALAALPETALVRELTALWALPSPPTLTAEEIVLSEYDTLSFLADGSLRVQAAVRVRERSEQSREQTLPPTLSERQWSLFLQMQDGHWSVLPEAAPAVDGPVSEHTS